MRRADPCLGAAAARAGSCTAAARAGGLVAPPRCAGGGGRRAHAKRSNRVGPVRVRRELTTVLHNEPNLTRASRFGAICRVGTLGQPSSAVPDRRRLAQAPAGPVSQRALSQRAPYPNEPRIPTTPVSPTSPVSQRAPYPPGPLSLLPAWHSGRAVRHGPNLVVTQPDRPHHRPRAQTIKRWQRPALEQSPLRVVCYHTPSMRCRSGSHCQHPAEKGRRFCAEHAAELDRMREELKDAAAARIGRGRPKRSSTCCRPGCYEPRVPPAAYCDTCVGGRLRRRGRVTAAGSQSSSQQNCTCALAAADRAAALTRSGGSAEPDRRGGLLEPGCTGAFKRAHRAGPGSRRAARHSLTSATVCWP